jgi:hypothetical protein
MFREIEARAESRSHSAIQPGTELPVQIWIHAPKSDDRATCLDPEVLDWLRLKAEGHLTRINDVPTNLMEAEWWGAGSNGIPGLRIETWGTQSIADATGHL